MVTQGCVGVPVRPQVRVGFALVRVREGAKLFMHIVNNLTTSLVIRSVADSVCGGYHRVSFRGTCPLRGGSVGEGMWVHNKIFWM